LLSAECRSCRDTRSGSCAITAIHIQCPILERRRNLPTVPALAEPGQELLHPLDGFAALVQCSVPFELVVLEVGQGLDHESGAGAK
jgi:hypothetical protein